MKNRIYYLLGFVLCFGLLGFGLYLQHVKGLEPCPLCIFQRVCFIALGIIYLIALIHNPGRKGVMVYDILTVIAAVTGVGVAGRHVWLELYPPKVRGCGMGFDYMWESLPFNKLLDAVFRGSGDCSEVAWRFLGLSIPDWALIFFCAMTIAAFWHMFKKR
jgi:disulfide bond formation protein DsbB